ncbi:acyltransferase protein [Rutstroemia sp. NJR-2017a WRK4]|nr:acyltransferase protein [Rutstroemia sp. NJR-2017a WRK4]
MEKDYRPNKIWAMNDTDDASHSDYTVILSSGKRLLQKLAHGCVPSFLQRRTIRANSPKAQRLHPTSYLDGLRGVASFIVFMGHYTEENIGWWTEPYGLYEDGAPSSPIQLPFLRVIYSARPMVHIFFIISGYVLAYKPLKQIHTQQYAALASTLSSSVFRRALRLFLPSFITLLIMALAVHCGISEPRYGFPLYSLSSQLENWYQTCWELLQSAWAWDDPSLPLPRYNPALWTIPVEFAQSMLLFIVILGLSHVRITMRLFILACIISFCFWSAQLHAVEFLGGMLIAELTLLQSYQTTSSPLDEQNSPLLPTSELLDIPGSPSSISTSTSQSPSIFSFSRPCTSRTTSSIKQTLVQTFWILNVISGLFISSWTNAHISEVPGLSILDAHTPSPYHGQRVWFCLAAFQIVLACTQLPSLQSIFNHPLSQYLGNISYALYLTHNLCLTAMEPRIAPLLDAWLGKDTFTGRHLTWLAGLLIYGPVILWMADLFWRVVDVRTVKLARWVESWCLVEKGAVTGLGLEGQRRRGNDA